MMVEDQCSRYTRSVAVARTSALRCGMLTNRPEEEPPNDEGKTAYRGEQSDGKRVGENPAYRQRHHPPKAHLHAVDDNPLFFEAWLEATRDGAVYRRGFLALDVGLGRDTCQSRVTQSQDSLSHNFNHSSRFDNYQGGFPRFFAHALNAGNDAHLSAPFVYLQAFLWVRW